MPVWLFVFLGVLAIISAFGVILQRNPVHSLLSLAFVLVVIGVLFIGLNAETVGLLQIIIYVGAIMVLFLFVIWLLNLQIEPGVGTSHLALKFFGSLAAAALIAELFVIFFRAPVGPMPHAMPYNYGSIRSLGRLLFSGYLIAFEVTSILLLVGVVGAIALARRVSGDLRETLSSNLMNELPTNPGSVARKAPTEPEKV
ncbi:MAG: NADH-quinone oxidoreductase subunit J family protein [Candidatus Binataceae bacterium]